jgi:hypothetical protein
VHKAELAVQRLVREATLALRGDAALVHHCLRSLDWLPRRSWYKPNRSRGVLSLQLPGQFIVCVVVSLMLSNLHRRRERRSSTSCNW